MHTNIDQAIVITGMGCLLPGANTVDEFWQRLLDGSSAISRYEDELIDSSLIKYFGRLSAEQNAMADEAVPFKLRSYSTQCSRFGVKAAHDALQRAGLDLKQIPEDRCGLFTAQGDYMYPSLPSFTRGIAAAAEKQSLELNTLTNEFLHERGIDFFLAVKGLANNLLAIASLTFKIRGDCGAFVQDDSAGISALSSAIFSLRHGYCDTALLICAGSYNEVLTLAELHGLGYLSPCNEGATSLRPFDSRCDGTILGEGAVAFVLETATHARQRQAVPLAEVSGISSLVEIPNYSAPKNTYHRCVEQALAQAKIKISDMDAIVVNGKGSYMHDQQEISLLSAIEKESTQTRQAITCATPITGKLPSCPTEWLTAVNMLQHGLVPPIAHLEQPADKNLQFVCQSPLQHVSHRILTLSSGYVGEHLAAIFSKPVQ